MRLYHYSPAAHFRSMQKDMRPAVPLAADIPAPAQNCAGQVPPAAPFDLRFRLLPALLPCSPQQLPPGAIALHLLFFRCFAALLHPVPEQPLPPAAAIVFALPADFVPPAALRLPPIGRCAGQIRRFPV